MLQERCRKLFNFVAYVSDVRMESGKIWRYDEELLAKELIKLRLQYLEGFLHSVVKKERKSNHKLLFR